MRSRTGHLAAGMLLGGFSVLVAACGAALGPPAPQDCLSRPCAADDSYSIPVGFGPKELSVLLNDINAAGQTGGADLSITTVSPATSGVVSIAGGATTVTYEAPLGFAGTATFAYTITDTATPGDGPSTATVTVKVQ